MAVIHQAQLHPSKRELLAAWLPQQTWGAPLEALVGAYRLDDPDGAVGIEVHLARGTDGLIRQVPLTYRGAPFVDAALIGTLEHSVLGTRWVYDGLTDPVALQALVAVIRVGGTEAQEWVAQESGPPVERPTTARVRGVPPADRAATELAIRRVLDGPGETAAAGVLLGTWADQDEPVQLARLT